MAYLNKDALNSLGLKHLGSNVLISDKCSIYNPDQIEIYDNSRIDDFCVISGNVKIGRFVHLAPFCLIAGGEKGVEFEDFSGCAYHAQVFSQSDDYSGTTMTNPTIPTKYKNEFKKKVLIGRHVIIGAGSMVLPGVTVAEGCSIGAMSMLTKSTDAWGIYFGIPAKKIKSRKKDLLILESEFMKEGGL